MMDDIIIYLIVFLLYALITALVVLPLTLAVMLSGWWLLLYIATIPTAILIKEFI